MNFLFIRQGVLAIWLLAGLAVFTGCQEAADPEGYQEYSDLENIKDQDQAKNRRVANGSDEAPVPAIAEKPNQPAIAQASDKRKTAGESETVSIVNPANNVRSRPGDLVIANEGTEKREIKLLVPEKRFTKASADGTLRVSYDDIDLLKILNAEPVPLDVTDYFPEWLEQLEGQRIRIRGFMYPAYQDTGIRVFVLARDNDICCFGRDPKVYDLIRVEMREGTTTHYIPNRPFDVVGTFHIVPETSDEAWFGLYEIRDAEVITGR